MVLAFLLPFPLVWYHPRFPRILLAWSWYGFGSRWFVNSCILVRSTPSPSGKESADISSSIDDATNRASKAAMLIEEEANVEPETESIVKVAKKRRSVCFQNLSPTESSIGKLVIHRNLGNWAIENIYKRLKSVMVSPDVEPHCETSKTCPLR